LKSGTDLETALLKTVELFSAFELQPSLVALFQYEFVVGVTK
jgi:hypothetical protein